MTNETKIKVHMVANDHGEAIRMVQLPKRFEVPQFSLEYLLEAVFENGQNDIQPIPMTCSVSIGDVIEMNGKFHVVQTMGFQEMTAEELEEYKAIDENDRTWSKFVRPEFAAKMAAKETQRLEKRLAEAEAEAVN